MKIILKALSALWRIWFYTSVLLGILLLLPFLIVTSLSVKTYKQFFFLSRVWAWVVLVLSGFWPKVKWHEKPQKNQVYIICPNHVSMIDIMLTLALFGNCFLFIGKKELSKMPLFGYFYKRTNLLVDRKSLRSRKDVFDRAAVKIDQGIGLCIYPEGGVPEPEIELAPFKLGAFRLAADKNIPIIPVSYLNNKRHLPFDFWRGKPGVLQVVVHPFLLAKENSSEEIERLKTTCFNTILEPLEQADIKAVAHEIG